MDSTARLHSLLGRAPQLLYAKQEMTEGSSRILLRYNDLEEAQYEYFDTPRECTEVWEAFMQTMTVQCTPACIVVGGSTLFQPGYLERIACYSNERAHFVILDFGNTRNLWMGYDDRSEQVKVYHALLAVLGLEIGEKDKAPSVH